jgi:hypothetical protein
LSSLVWGGWIKRKKKRTEKKTHTFVVLGSVSGVVGADAVGEVAGAAMGDRCGGHGCGTPGQKGKEKGKKKLTFFFWYLYQVPWAHTWWADVIGRRHQWAGDSGGRCRSRLGRGGGRWHQMGQGRDVMTSSHLR